MRQRRIYAAIREAHEETGYPIELACKLLHAAAIQMHAYAPGGFVECKKNEVSLCVAV